MPSRTTYGIMITMDGVIRKYYIYRSRWFRINRIIFPSPAELRFIEIMGGRVFRLKYVRHPRTKFPIAYIASMGKVLRDEKFKREVRVGKYFLDFGNDVFCAIEIDGRNWHMDVVAEFERDSYIYQRGWRIKHIDAIKLWNQPDQVQREILKFLYT